MDNRTPELAEIRPFECLTREELLNVVRIQQEQNDELRALLADQHEQMMAIGAGGVTSGQLMFNEIEEQISESLDVYETWPADVILEARQLVDAADADENPVLEISARRIAGDAALNQSMSTAVTTHPHGAKRK